MITEKLLIKNSKNSQNHIIEYTVKISNMPIVQFLTTFSQFVICHEKTVQYSIASDPIDMSGVQRRPM